MKKILLTISLAIIMLIPTNVFASAGGYTIEDFKVIVNVNENNVLNIEEKISVNFSESRHGIYRFIPEWLEYTSHLNETAKRKSEVSNLRVDGFAYTTDVVDGKKLIKIGNEGQTVIGPITYSIKYDFNMGHDAYDGFDEFILHLYGDFWDGPIKNPSFEIHFPKSINEKNISFWCDKWRSCNIEDEIMYYMNGNILYGTVTRSINDALTVQVVLPDNYFVGTTSVYGYIGMILSILVLEGSLLCMTWWYKYGRNYPRRSSTVEFYPPDNMSSAEIDYIYNCYYQKNGGSLKKAAIATIIVLAKKEYIRLDEIEESTKAFGFKAGVTKKIKITKLKDYDGNDTVEKLVYDNLFFGATAVDVVKAPIINAIKNVKDITNVEEVAQSEGVKEVILNDSTTFYNTFFEIKTHLDTKMKYKVIDKQAKYYRKISMYIFIASIFSYAIIGTVNDLDPKYGWFYILLFLGTILTFIFMIIMGRKTPYAENILPRIKGFKNFLEKAEKSQLEKLVEENPHYYYDILPYAYVLNVSSKWIKKFEDIKIPTQESMGTFNYYNMSSFDSMSSSIYSPSSDSSGGCGGGGCGGGGCGGGGSW